MSGTPIADPRPALQRTAWIVACTALVLLAIAAGLVYRRVAMGRLTFELEARAYSVAERFGNTTWRQLRGFALTADRLDARALRASPEVATIGSSLTTLTEGLAVVNIQVYAKSGMILYASDPARIGNDAPGQTVLQMLAEGYFGRGRADVMSRMGRVDAHAADGSPVSLDAVTTWAVLRNDDTQVKEGAAVAAPYEVLAVLEISQDATAEVGRITRVAAITIAVPIAVSTLILAFGVLRQVRSQKEGAP